ncbi:5558_t:CDS:1, partial [Acaulospora colombiana]
MIIQEATDHIHEIQVIDGHIHGVIKVVIIDIGEMGLDIDEIQIAKNLNMVVKVNILN